MGPSAVIRKGELEGQLLGGITGFLFAMSNQKPPPPQVHTLPSFRLSSGCGEHT